MIYSQLKYYSASDSGAPQLSGEAGKLLDILNAVLVNGYGAKTSAGWTKPFVDAGNCGGFTQGASSSGHSLFINDNGPSASTYQTAWVTGWSTLGSIAAPVGTGQGQFPLPAQLLTTGHAVWYKSATASTVLRDWMMFADGYSFLLAVYHGAASGYSLYHFGDIFAYSPGTTDTGRCAIWGQGSDTLGAAGVGIDTTLMGSSTNQHYISRGLGGIGGSIAFGKLGDYARQGQSYLEGNNACPNPGDNSLYLAPVIVHESSSTRGQIRGLWHIGHSSSNFSNGQLLYGAGTLAGKVIQVLKMVAAGSGSLGFCGIEVSATVETNS